MIQDPWVRTSIHIGKDQHDHLLRIREDVGIPVAVTVRKAIGRYLADLPDRSFPGCDPRERSLESRPGGSPAGKTVVDR